MSKTKIPDKLTSAELQKLIKLGVLRYGKDRLEINELLPEYKKLIERNEGIKKPIQQSLFSDSELPQPIEKVSNFAQKGAENELKEITIELNRDIISKQSTRFNVARHRNDGHNFEGIALNKGDVVLYRNKQSGRVDVIIQVYTEADIEKEKKVIVPMIEAQLPDNWIPFANEVHILQWTFIFPHTSNFSKKEIEALGRGEKIYKTTKPDLPDNCKKLYLDCMNKLVYIDDALICHEAEIEKIYGFAPKIVIKLKGR